MSSFSKFIALAAAAVALAACGQKAVINGTLADAPSSEVIVKLLDVNKYKVLDTVEVTLPASLHTRLTSRLVIRNSSTFFMVTERSPLFFLRRATRLQS